MGDAETGTLGKVAASAVVIVLAIPGLVVEPGPLSEIAAIGILAAMWFGGEDPEEAIQGATGKGDE